MARRIAIAIASSLLVLLVLGLRPVRDDEMAYTLRPGDWVLLLPLTPQVGDVVRLTDPLDPQRSILRRIMALGGARVAFRGATPTLDGMPLRHLEMFRDPSRLVVLEDDRALLTMGGEVVLGDVPPSEVASDAVYLAADHRDTALDSRHWGPVPQTSLGWVVALRLGRPGPWQRVLEVP